MALDARQLNLFGLDLGRLWQHFRAGLAEAAHWPALAWLRPMHPVRLLQDDGGESLYPAQEHGVSLSARYTACVLPEPLTLVRRINVPDLTDDELRTLVTGELAANSPFAPEDTVHGWRLDRSGTEDRSHTLVIAFSSRRHVRDHLKERAAPTGAEVWAQADGMVVLQGYGECRRKLAEARELRLRLAALAFSLLAVLAIPGVHFMTLRAQVLDAQQQLVQTEARAADALAVRSDLSAAQLRLSAVQQLGRGPNVLSLLETLASLTPDDSYYHRLDINGDLVRGNGESADGARLIEIYSNDARLAELRSPQPISRVAARGLDTFSVEFRYRPDGGGVQ